MGVLQILEEVQTAPAGQRQVQNNKVPGLFPDRLERLGFRTRLAHHRIAEMTQENLHNAFPHQGMIVND